MTLANADIMCARSLVGWSFMVSCNKNAAPGVQMAPGSLSLRCLQRPLRLNCGVLPAGRESIPSGSGFVGWQVSSGGTIERG